MKAVFCTWMTAVTVLFGVQGARGATYTNTATGGDWGTAASWIPNTGTPGAGDSIVLSGAGTITVSSNQQFGLTSGSGTSSWTTFSTIAMTGGSVLTHNASDKFSYSQGGTGSFILSGSGTFLNLGNLQNDGSYARLLGLRSGLTLENRGTLTFNGNYTSMNVDGTSKLFNNDGTISVTASFQGFIGSTGTGAQFTTYDSSTSTLKGLAVSIGNSAKLGLGYYYSDSSQTLSGTVKISSLSMGNSSSALEFGNVDLTLSTSAANTLTGAGILNLGSVAGSGVNKSTLTVGGNQTWDFAGGVNVASTSTGTTLKLAGNTVTIAKGFTTSGGSNVFLDGGTGGKLVLQGNSAIGQGWRGIAATNGVTVENQGTFTFGVTDVNPDALTLDGTSRFYNNGGTISVIRTAGVGASADGGVFTNYDSGSSTFKSLTLSITNSKTFSLGTDFNGTYQPMNKRLDGRVNFTALDVAADSALQIGRYNNLTFRGDFTAAGALKLEASSTFAIEDDVTVAMGQGLTWDSSTIATNGHTLTLNSNATAAGGGDNTVAGNGSTGRLINNGAYVSNIMWRGLNLTNGVTFENRGTFSHTNTDDANINPASGCTFLNAASGTVTLALGASGYAYITGAGTFDNAGTLAAGSGTVYVNVTSVPQFSGSNLTGGTWKATGSGTIMNVKYSGRSNVATIGPGATVILENGATIDAINTALTTVNGGFYVNGMSFASGGALAVGSTGTLGGSGTITANVTLNNGTVALNAGTITGTMSVNGGAWNGTGTVSGLTSVAAGKTYTLSGTQTGNVTLGAGATLMGSGTIAGTVTAAGAVLAPGTSPGTLTATTLALDSTSVLNFELGDSLTPGASDQVVTTNLTLDGTINIAALGGFGIPAGAGFARYTLLSYQNLAADGGLVLGTYPAASFNYVLDQTTGVGAGPGQVFLIIPEPSALALLVLAALGALARRREGRGGSVTG